MSLVILLTGPALIDLMTTSPEVREEARRYLPWLVAAPLIGVAAWIYDGIFIGALLTGQMVRAMLISVVVYVAGAAGSGADAGQPRPLGRTDDAECDADLHPVAALSKGSGIGGARVRLAFRPCPGP